MSIANYTESWKDIYEKYKDVVNFVAGDYDSLKSIIRYYVTLQNPENFNDWAESSETGIFVNGLAYLGESLHYRVDLNAHDVFPSTTERKQSLLNFTKMLSYSPKRNICANGIAKVVSISTTQPIYDMLGKSLKDVTITWNDSTDEDWQERFLLVLNSVFATNNPYGKPLKKETVDTITSQLYQLNTTTNMNCGYPFSAYINGSSQQFSIVNADIDTTSKIITERTPIPEQAFHILYRNDGSGNSSKNTGFFVFWKQGTLNYEYINFNTKIENNSYELNATNINEYDLWLQEVNSSSGLLKTNWTKIDNSEYLTYNNTNTDVKTIYKAETRENDGVILRFSDGSFGDIPYGLFRAWYRVSQGNSNLYIKPSDIKNISVSIPYTSNNTTDDNVYYLTMTFSVQDVSHIYQSVAQEQMDDIRERAPELYSTQNRMVTGEDYNNFPKSFGSLIKKSKSILRNFTGNSRYVQFNEGTGTYQDLNILAEDGYIYSSESIDSSEIVMDITTTPKIVINDTILPLLNSINVENYYYNTYQTIKINGVLKWREKYSQGDNLSYGVLIDEDNNQLKYNDIKQHLTKGNLIKFTNYETDYEKWVSIVDVEYEENSEYDYLISINEVLTDDSNLYSWNMIEYYDPFISSFNSQTYNDIQNCIENSSSFGLNYDSKNRVWEIVDISDDSTNWLLKAEYSSPNMYSFSIKVLRYIFGSENKATFFFNTDTKLSDVEFYTKDYIKILSINGYNKDYYWKPCETIKYVDGYIDNRKVIVYGYNSDKDETVDNPTEFQDIINGKLQNLYFINDELKTSVKEINSLWDINSTSGIYFSKVSGTIYPAGTKLPNDVTITETVKLSNNQTIIATANNPHTWKKGSIYEYDIIDSGYTVDFIWASSSDPTIESDYLLKYTKEKVESELISWNNKSKELYRYSLNEYDVRQGLYGLSFIWQHYASSKHLIDPCTTNIIDMYVLTNSYYNSVYNWLQNGKIDDFPQAPTTSELKSSFSSLENYDMISDTMVWHSIRYKVLFGNQSDNEYKASFRVIKNDSTSLSDNEIKKQIIDCIDEYFQTMESGQTFYYTKLSAYIEQEMGTNINSVVIVPSYSSNKFGNLFEINCDEDEILISSATIDDVQIITKMSQSNIKIGN